MATEQELRERVASLEADQLQRAKRAAVAEELGRHDIASPAAAEQIAALLLPSVQITKVSDGRELAHGPDYKPLAAMVAETLERPDYAHFLAPKGAVTSAQPAAPAGQPAAPASGPQSDAREILPGENFGSAVIRVASNKRAAQGDPRLDPAQPMGLGRGIRPQ
jgi:hypothetical protein